MEKLHGDEQLQLYEQIVANMANGVYMLRVSDGIIVYANPKFEKLFGYNPKELEGIHVSKLNAPTKKSPEQIAKEITQALKECGEWHGEVKNIKKDGTTFWCHADVSTFNHSVYGKVFVAVHSDITERIHANQKLKETRLLLKSSIESPKDLIILSIDNQFHYLYFNNKHKATMLAVYGIKISIGMNILDCITNEEDRLLAKACYTRALNGESHTQINEYGEEHDRLYYETFYNPIYNDTNKIIGATAFANEITDRIKVERDLKESEERFKKLSELTNEGIIIHKNGVCLDVNNLFLDILGYTKAELIGKNLIEMIIDEKFYDTVYRNMTNNLFEPYEIVAKRKNGELIDVLIGGRKEILYNGEKVFVTTASDITEQKKNELKVKKSEADLISQIENTSDTIWSVDKNYRITITNSNFFNSFNLAFNHELRLGDCVLDYLPESLQQSWKERYDRALQGEHFSMVDKFNYENVPQYSETAFNPVIVDGKVVGAACFAKDITKQKTAEKALKISEKKFKKLSEFSPASISIQRTDQYFYVNKSWEMLTGYTRKEALSLTPLDIIHPDSVEKIKKRSDARLKGEPVPNRYDLKILTKTKEVKWIDISFSIIEYENQTASLGVCFDVTELKKAKEALIISEHELKIANATKNKFFSIIAHDLRSPFSSILGFSNLLSSAYDNLNDNERKKYISEISSTSNRTFLLLENLLNWARAQQGGIVIHKEPLNLKNFISSAIEPYMTNAIQKNIKINSCIPDDLLLFADKYTILTAIGNLFNNAVKYSFKGGSIDIKAEKHTSDIVISISDYGVGMSQTMISKLFLLLENFSTLGTNDERGTGLGLTLCKEFVELNGGTLSVNSVEGKGSTFSFNLPI